MSVVKVVEVMSNSTESWEDATAKGITKASQSVKNIKSAYVKEQSVRVKNNQISEYRVNLKISFEVE